jgi:hypothetical protein
MGVSFAPHGFNPQVVFKSTQVSPEPSTVYVHQIELRQPHGNPKSAPSHAMPVPQTDQVKSKSSQALPKSAEGSTSSAQINAKSNPVSPESSQVITKSSQVSPGSRQASTQSSQVRHRKTIIQSRAITKSPPSQTRAVVLELTWHDRVLTWPDSQLTWVYPGPANGWPVFTRS